MTGRIKLLCLAASVPFAFAQSNRPATDATTIRLLISEVQPGSMASEQYCTLVFANRRFHSEKAVRKVGKDHDRKIYEGELSEPDWNALAAILDNKDLQDIVVPQSVPPMVMDNVHTYAISVAREGKYQNMEFLDNKSRKPYDAQLKPLLGWWKALRGKHMTVSNADPDPKCALDDTHAVFAQ